MTAPISDGEAQGDGHWARYHLHWPRLGPPLRPTEAVIAAFRRALDGSSDRVLLLGVTPELAHLGAELVAVDRNEGMIAAVWPGDGASRRVIRADWGALPFPSGHFTAVVGDGAFTNMTYPSGYFRLFAELARVLARGGRIVHRSFVAPDDPERVDDVCAAARAGAIGSFHAFKWRLAMAAAAAAPGAPNLRVEAIRAAFERAFPDRDALAAATGWRRLEIDTIDVYRGSTSSYSFPTASELAAVVPSGLVMRSTPTDGYELAERCPLVVLDRA